MKSGTPLQHYGLEEGLETKIVSEILGHASVATTADIYSHVTPTMHDQAAEIMHRLFGTSS